MPTSAIIAAQQGIGLPTRPKALYIDGLDVLLAPGGQGNAVGVPLDTIELTEAGSGATSRLVFRIEDPAGSVTLQESANVLLMDIARNVPLFRGWLNSWTPAALGVGREIECEAVGIEAALDWAFVPPVTIAAGTKCLAAVQKIVAASVGLPLSLRIAYDGGSGQSTQEAPTLVSSVLSTPEALDLTGTLRDCLMQLLDSLLPLYSDAVSGWWLSVDFYGGLRAWPMLGGLSDDGVTSMVQDYRTLTLSSAGASKPTGTQDTTTGTYHSVWVTGGNPAGTGLVSDGTGLPGPVGEFSDSNVLTVAARIAAGRGWLGRQVASAGSVEAAEVTNVGSLGSERRAGSVLILTDSQLGITARRCSIQSITKRFLASGTEWWTIDYGRAAPSGVSTIRRLTRQNIS